MSITKPCENCASTNAAYLLLCRDMDRMTEQRNALAAQAEQLREALKTLWFIAPAEISCHYVNHQKKHRHSYDEPCPLETEYTEAMTNAEEAISMRDLSTEILRKRDAELIERCAKECESIDAESFGVLPVRAILISDACAKTIRAMGETHGQP